MKSQAHLLGIDLGTSTVKALIADQNGSVLGQGSTAYPIHYPQPGYAEQDPDEWWAAVALAVRKASASVEGPVHLAGIGLSGQMHGAILLDSHKRLLHPAVIWLDRRSEDQVREVTERIGRERLIEIAGSPLATGFQAATLWWFQHKLPQTWGQVSVILLPKDYLRWRLTGEFASDPSDGSGALLLDVWKRTWSREILDILEIDMNQLPPIQPSHSVAGTLTRESAEHLGLPIRLPVVTGAADTACSLLGAGVTKPGDLLLTISTGGQLVLPIDDVSVDLLGRTHTFCSALEPSESPPVSSPADVFTRGPGGAGWYRMGATLSAGGSLRWLCDQIFALEGEDAYDRLTALASEAPVSSKGLIFLPYLSGERTPLMDPAARGVFLGLTLAHGRAELVRAVMEGVTLSLYEAYLAVVGSGPSPDRIVLAGGGARSSLWQQMVADVFYLPVHPVRIAEASALGAAWLAGAGLGVLEPPRNSWIDLETGPTVEPGRRSHDLYIEILDIFRSAYQAHRVEFERLNKLQG